MVQRNRNVVEALGWLTDFARSLLFLHALQLLRSYLARELAFNHILVSLYHTPR
ncbi:hypothetical protein Krac_7944 [Ktedonobacter racemifer DSM 44963]|uniref:Uncharacterized protein n=1 Tax=Ktedonobacter racemifer DSM 44963 TaxID=485913 RepID=D6TLI6_KTERA|nr:hypothetical protein Krac_7944 [Ktedonobacter racemifer DSM 44963]